MNKKNMLCIWICILGSILTLSGCHNTAKPNSVPDIQIKQDLTVALPVAYDIPADADFQDVYAQADYAFSSDISTLSSYADTAVRGVVQEVTFTSYDGDAFTAVSFAVDECYKGDLQKGDLITILHRGGYIPLQDHINRYNDGYMFESLSSEEIANTVLHEVYEGEPDPQAGDHNIYFLHSPNSDSNLPAEAYQRVRGAVSLFRVASDGETVSRRNYDMYMGAEEDDPDAAASLSAQNNAESYGNEVFSLQEIVEIASAN